MCFDIYLESGSLNDVQGAESFDREKLFLRVKKWVHLNNDLKDCFCTEGERSENHLVCVLRHLRLSYCTALEQGVCLWWIIWWNGKFTCACSLTCSCSPSVYCWNRVSVFRADWVDVALYIIMRIGSVYNKERVFFWSVARIANCLYATGR